MRNLAILFLLILFMPSLASARVCVYDDDGVTIISCAEPITRFYPPKDMTRLENKVYLGDLETLQQYPERFKRKSYYDPETNLDFTIVKTETHIGIFTNFNLMAEEFSLNPVLCSQAGIECAVFATALVLGYRCGIHPGCRGLAIKAGRWTISTLAGGAAYNLLNDWLGILP